MGHHQEYNSGMEFEGFCRIWDSMTNSTDIAKLHIAVYVICYLLNGPKLRTLALSIGNKKTTMAIKKHYIADSIASFYYKLYTLSKSNQTQKAFNALKRQWKDKYHVFLKGPYPEQPAVNNIEPFSMEPLSDLDANIIFSYKDHHNKVYAFDGPSLLMFLKTSPPLNPFTRERIPIQDITRLEKLFGDSIPLHVLAKTPRDAFTTLSHELTMRMGLYIRVDDLLCLTGQRVTQLFLNFRTATATNSFIRLEVLDDIFQIYSDDELELEQQLLMCFASEFIVMLKSDHMYSMYYSCVLCLCLASTLPCISESIPSWVYDASESNTSYM